IRLLRLFHGKFDDDIRVELEEAWLDEIEAQGADGTSFKALSYVWGSRDNPATIWIGEETISVTQNLAAALRHLRDEHDDGVYWIDAICIDQSSPSERSKQVALMRDVFRVAGEVIFWLGPEENDSDHAMDLIHSFGEKVRYDIRSDALIPIDKPGDEAKWLSPLEPVRYGDREADALADLLMRPWFERLWVRQEAFHGRKSGVVMCGTRRMS
ncbi:heterokaryon incompatibility protein-domain-containing protein, partial [Immersiella caudata]